MYTLLNGYYTPYRYKSLSPYISGGIGVSQNKAGAYNSKSSDGSTTVYRSSDSTTKLDFAWSLGLGFVTDVSDHLSVDVFYKYVDLGNSGKMRVTTTSTKGYTGFDDVTRRFRNNQIGIGFIWRL